MLKDQLYNISSFFDMFIINVSQILLTVFLEESIIVVL